MRPPRSLKARALQWLAQREHSRLELRRKLMPYARAEVAASAAQAAQAAVAVAAAARGAEAAAGDANSGVTEGADSAGGGGAASAASRVDAVLDWLAAQQFQSQARFVESRVHARSARFGNLRIRQELKQHDLALSPQAAQALKDTELQRARAVRQRKFALWPAEAGDRARQARFLAGRGFSPDVIARTLRAEAAEDASDD